VRRLHLFELEDQPWYPTWLRNLQTDYLAAGSRWLGMYDAVLPLLRPFSEILDLCSGGGGPWERWAAKNQLPSRVTLSDRFPNHQAFQHLQETYGIPYAPEPVDALNVPPRLPGARTLFTAIHHFSPEQVQQLCRDAVASAQPLAAFDFNQRSLPAILGILPGAWLMCWLLTPLIRPFRLTRLFWTYAIPLVPAVAAWDGLMSQLRAYTPAELQQIADSVPGYRWRAGHVRWLGVLPVTYLVGEKG
jgi:hypothetical protein